MSFRGWTRLPACRHSRVQVRCFRTPGLFATSVRPIRLSIDPRTSRGGSWQQQRGVKTKTGIKFNDLPQGQLPALPPEPSDNVPTKTYPTVLQQHLNNMRKFTDCIILTRVGDFYEMYFEQVDQYAHLVNLKKAKRSTVLGDVPMAGFQHTQLDRYLRMFVQDLGKQVAISEQVRIPDEERARTNSTMRFDRKVTRVVTPGTLVDENFVDPYENNYLLAVHVDGVISSKGAGAEYEWHKRSTKVGLSWVDLSSGDFFTQLSDLASLQSVVARIGPREVVVSDTLEVAGPAALQQLLGEYGHSVHFHRPTSNTTTVAGWAFMLERPVPETEHDEFTWPEVAAGSLVLDYIQDKLQGTQIQLQPPARRSDEEYMAIDKHSLRGLEIRATIRDGHFQGSLLHAIRRTVTRSGARLLSRRLVSPSLSLSIIENRLDLVQEMIENEALQEEIVALLRLTSDTLRLLQRFSIGKGDADDLLGLASTIGVMERLAQVVHDHILASQDRDDTTPVDLGFMWDMLGRVNLEGPSKLAKTIVSAIDEEGLNRQHNAELEAREEASEMAEEVENAEASGVPVPKLARRAARSRNAANSPASSDADIWIMRTNASPSLERAHSELGKLTEAKNELLARLKKQLRADSLSLRWSAQLGHFCHVKGRDAQSSLSVVSGARSVSSTKSTRSFYVTDWTHLGTRIEDAKLRIRTEEERVFGKLRAQVIENLMKLRRNAAVLDELDVACSSAILAKENNLVRPVLDQTTSHIIVGGRHPTVDMSLRESGRRFTANDCAVGENETVQLITGPNMAGKSTYLRQNALITILAQTGCFVPADYAKIGLVDKIFSRVGSADNLYQDQSTFMVEMLETAEILKQATPKSFVIMDEVGRGTTPEDGIAVGYACLHHLHYINRSRALFATHFHALADMTHDFEALARYCTDVVEDSDGSWAYVHKMRRGVTRDSHALKVARMAGMPEEAIQVAEEVLKDVQRRLRPAPPSTRIERPELAANG